MHIKNEIKIFENDLNKKDKYFFSEDKNSIFLLNKIKYELEYIFSYNDIAEEKLCKLITPVFWVNNYNNILEERETLDICGNFLCGKKIKSKIPEGVFDDDKISKQFTSVNLSNIFCSKAWFTKFQEFLKYASKNYKITNWLNIDSILLFEAI